VFDWHCNETSICQDFNMSRCEDVEMPVIYCNLIVVLLKLQ
jgi:hypothetical protein